MQPSITAKNRYHQLAELFIVFFFLKKSRSPLIKYLIAELLDKNGKLDWNLAKLYNGANAHLEKMVKKNPPAKTEGFINHVLIFTSLLQNQHRLHFQHYRSGWRFAAGPRFGWRLYHQPQKQRLLLCTYLHSQQTMQRLKLLVLM